jgi:hypothetical protein
MGLGSAMPDRPFLQLQRRLKTAEDDGYSSDDDESVVSSASSSSTEVLLDEATKLGRSTSS